MPQTTGSKKPKQTAKEKYEMLEAKKDKYTAETQALYARIDELRKKVGQLEPEIQVAFKQYMSERKN